MLKIYEKWKTLFHPFWYLNKIRFGIIKNEITTPKVSKHISNFDSGPPILYKMLTTVKNILLSQGNIWFQTKTWKSPFLYSIFILDNFLSLFLRWSSLLKPSTCLFSNLFEVFLASCWSKISTRVFSLYRSIPGLNNDKLLRVKLIIKNYTFKIVAVIVVTTVKNVCNNSSMESFK